jgi:glycosyltransferase involved in cell wall biosynthesis
MEFVINGRFLTQPITGVQRYARELVQAFDEILDNTPSVKITVLTPRLSTTPPRLRNVELRQVGRLQGHIWEQIELPLYARGKTLFCPANTAPVISLLSPSPIVVTVHDLSYKYFPSAYHLAFRLWYKFLIPLVLRRANAMITVSQSEREAMLSHYPYAAPRLHAIANGSLPAAISVDQTRLSQRRDDFILYVGSLSRRKNFPRMFEVACGLAREHGFRFTFVGNTPKSLVSSPVVVPNDISSKITFVGAIDDFAALVPYYRTAACLLFPSLYESSGLPPIEAMTFGCPVVVSDIPALRERCGDAAVYCDPHNADSIRNAVLRLMQDERLRASLGTNGQKRAEGFTWRACAHDTLTLVNQFARSSTLSLRT